MPGEIRAIIADDEPLARRRLRRLCEREGDVRVIAEACDGAEAQALVADHRPDLLFLDVQMPEPNGLAVLESLDRERPPMVVLVTAHRDHAVEAFALDAVDYLLKPFDAERFRGTIERVRERQRARPAMRPAARIPVRDGVRVHFVETTDLEYVTAEGNYVTLHAGGRESLLRETLAAMEARLDPGAFVRVHRSTIVRIDRVVEIESVASGEYVLTLRGGATVTSGRSYRQAVASAFHL